MFFISLKNAFTAICSILTLFLVYQVLFTYIVERPTSTSKEVRPLEVADLPEVVICLDPGLNYTALIKYGYHGSYVMGTKSSGKKKFVGWNGGEGENKSSEEILEEALLVPDSWRFNKTRLIFSATYSEFDFDFNFDLEASIMKPSTGTPKSPKILAMIWKHPFPMNIMVIKFGQKGCHIWLYLVTKFWYILILVVIFGPVSVIYSCI